MRRGVVYDLAHVLHADIPAFPGRTFRQYLTTNYHQINRRRPDAGPAGWGRNNVNWIVEQVTATQQMGTHLDALNHLQVGDRTYNGHRLADIAEDHGTNRLGVDTLPQIVTRGVLARRRRGPRRRPPRPRRRDHRRRRSSRARAPRLDVRPGDAVFFHTGWGTLWGVGQRAATAPASPGPGMAARRAWLVEHGVALTGCDTWSYGAGAGRGSGRAVRRAADAQHPARRRRRREPPPGRARPRPGSPSSCSSSPTPSCAAPPARGSHRWPSSERSTDHDRPLRRHRHRLRRRRRHADPRARAHRREGAAARARRLAAPRGGELEPGRGLGRRALPQLRAAGPTRTASRSSPKQHYYVGGNTKVYGAILFRFRERDFERDPARRRHLAGLADLATPTSSPGTPGPSGSTRCTASAAPTRPSRRPPSPTRTRRSATSRGSPSCTHDLAGAGLHPFPLPERHPASTSPRPSGRACVRCATCDGFPCLVNGKADAQVICVEPALRHPNVTLLTDALRHPARDRRRPGARSTGSSSTATDRPRRTRPTSSSWPAARSTPPRCCCAPPTTGTRTGWATAPASSAGT